MSLNFERNGGGGWDLIINLDNPSPTLAMSLFLFTMIIHMAFCYFKGKANKAQRPTKGDL